MPSYNARLFLMRYKSIIVMACLLPLLLLMAIFLHIFRTPKDYLVESEIFSTLSKGEKYYQKSYFSGAEFVCFLPSYATSDGIKIHLHKSVLLKLDLMIKFNPFGTDDSFWWVVGINKDDVAFIYKMTGHVRPFPLNETVCVDAQKIVLEPLARSDLDGNSVHLDGKTIYFQVSFKQE